MASSTYPSDPDRFPHLSLHDLLTARDQYHVHLMRHPNVVATAIGRYRIRRRDSWPSRKGPGKIHGRYARTMTNSEVRPYSWPAILVFVSEWIPRRRLGEQPSDAIPPAVYLSDGRSVPICVVEAPREETTEVAPIEIRRPLNNIGGGSPIVAMVQGREHLATVACLVSDGHTTYALTNRHVAGEPGEVIYARRDGRLERIGLSSSRQLTREAFTTVYPGWPGRDLYVNLDLGLIGVDDLDRWTTDVAGVGQMDRMVDLSVSTISLDLIGQQVRGTGAATGPMRGEIQALFYRYKTSGGFEYVADVLIGPSTRVAGAERLATHPGDSGTLWLLQDESGVKTGTPPRFCPLALQWGRNVLYSGGPARRQSYVLATFLSRACALLGVDPIRNWNVDQPDTWGAIGHFSIAALAGNALSRRFPRLVKLIDNNATIISRDRATILKGDATGLGSAAFVPLADVPDFFWKPSIGKQGHARHWEGPNHFADMDQPGPDGKTLLDLCRKDSFIAPDKWVTFYDSVKDLLKNQPISATHRGLLPFRVWQIFDAMVGFAAKGNGPAFLCAAGVLTHYIGDACQPLHISYLHDGDPLKPVSFTHQSGTHAGTTEIRPLGMGVHSAYEDGMVNLARKALLEGLQHARKASKGEMVSSGFEAAKRTIEMMRHTFTTLNPRKIVDAYVSYDQAPKDRSAYLWKRFGTRTIRVMRGGCHLLAVLWESAWSLGNGESRVSSVQAITRARAMQICGDPGFLPSTTIDKIGSYLT